jgi:hypothetical protein
MQPVTEAADETEMPLPSDAQTFFLGGLFALGVFYCSIKPQLRSSPIVSQRPVEPTTLSGPSQLGLSLLQKYFSETLDLSGGRPFQGQPFPVHALLR